MKKTILYISMLFVLSCQNENKDVSIIKYFDSEVFVENEIKELSKKNLKATKEVTLNGKNEILKDIRVDSAFLYHEFELFREANINKSALLGKYSIDTFWMINAISLKDEVGYAYAPMNGSSNKLKTKKISLYSDNKYEFKNFIGIEMVSSNFMHAYAKRCYYSEGNFISIYAWEKTLFQDTLFYETIIRFE